MGGRDAQTLECLETDSETWTDESRATTALLREEECTPISSTP